MTERDIRNIPLQTLRDLDVKLAASQRLGKQEFYSAPIIAELKDNQPILFLYTQTRSLAALQYLKSPEVLSGYLLGTAIGYDIMTSYLKTQDRKVDVGLTHIALYDPFFAMATVVAGTEASRVGESMLNEDWFYMTWINYDFGTGKTIGRKRPNPEFDKFRELLELNPALKDFIEHSSRVLWNNSVTVRNGMTTGLCDQIMIYFHRLEDVDGPDARYVVNPDGTKTMPFTPR